MTTTVWKMSKYGVISGPYLDTFHVMNNSCSKNNILEWKLNQSKNSYCTQFFYKSLCDTNILR